MDTVANYTEGRWVSGEGPSLTVIDPATAEPIAELASATQDDGDAAVRAVKRAFDPWRRFPASRRAEIIFGAAEEMIRR